MKTIKYLLGVTFLFGLIFGLIKLDHKRELNSKIQEITKSEADSRKLCTSEDAQSRLDCMKPRLNKVKNPNFKNSFSLFIDGQKEEVESTDEDTVVKIKRIPSMFLGGSCVSSFFYFDFDNHFIYLSKDNLSGIVVCRSGDRRMILFPSQLSSTDLQKEIHSLTNLSF